MAYSGFPTFSLTPLTKTSITVPPNTSGNVQYLVTNNTKITRTLTMVPIKGVQQLTQGVQPGSNICTNPFTLAPGSGCILSLQINGSILPGPWKGGPVICKTNGSSNTPSQFLCSRPAQSALLNIQTTTNPPIKTETIVFMRDGEKSSSPLGEMDCQGENRSIVLPKVVASMFGRPNYLFAPNPAIQDTDENPSNPNAYYNLVGPLGLIEPTAVQLGMPINTQYGFYYVDAVASELILPSYQDSLLYVVWDHVNLISIIQYILATINSNIPVPQWPDDSYDPLYVLTITTYPNNVQLASLVVGAEGLNGQSMTCPTPFSSKIYPKPIPPATGAKTLLFIPEGESASGGYGQLSCKGWNRALALGPSLTASYGAFDVLYSPGTNFLYTSGPTGQITEGSGTYDYLRAMMTIQPSIVYQASFLGQPSIPTPSPLNPLYPYTEVNTVADAILSLGMPSPADESTSYAIAWQAAEMVPLVQMVYQGLGGNISVIPTSEPDADTMYQITITSNGQLSFNIVPENLNKLPHICYQP